MYTISHCTYFLAVIFIPRLLAFVEYCTLDSIITPVRIYRISGSSHLCISSFEPETTIAEAMASVTIPKLPL